MGITLNVRDAYSGPAPVAFSDIGDNFDRSNGPLKGSFTPAGGKMWNASVGDGAPQPIISGGRVKAQAGMSGNVPIVFNAGARDYDIVARLGAVSSRAEGPVPEIIFNYASSGEYASVRLRSVSDPRPGFVLAHRPGGGGYTVVDFDLGRVPAGGDVIWVQVRGSSVTVRVNGEQLLSGDVAPAGSIVGMLFNSVDTDTSFEDYCVYFR